MEFLGVGYQELLLILVLLLVVVGPERLPTMAYQIGRAVRTLQQYARAVRNEFRDEFEYLEEQYRTVRGEVDAARVELQKEQAAWQRELQEAAAIDLPPLIEEPKNGASPSPAGSASSAPSAPAESAAPAQPASPPAQGATSPPNEEKPPAPPMVF